MHQPTRHKAKTETKKRLFAVGWMLVLAKVLVFPFFNFAPVILLEI